MVQILLLVLGIVQLLLVMVLAHCTITLGHGTVTFTSFKKSTITLGHGKIVSAHYLLFSSQHFLHNLGLHTKQYKKEEEKKKLEKKNRTEIR